MKHVSEFKMNATHRTPSSFLSNDVIIKGILIVICLGIGNNFWNEQAFVVSTHLTIRGD
jgi:hypothetical protein